MSKFFKGIAKVVKNIGKGIKKVFKKVVKSKIFKIVLIAVAIYFGDRPNNPFLPVDTFQGP